MNFELNVEQLAIQKMTREFVEKGSSPWLLTTMKLKRCPWS